MALFGIGPKKNTIDPLISHSVLAREALVGFERSGGRECQTDAANMAANLNRSNLELSLEGGIWMVVLTKRLMKVDPLIKKMVSVILGKRKKDI